MTRHLDAIIAIALNTFREIVRDRIIYVFMLFAFGITLLAILLGSLSVGQDMRILDDMGMAAIALIGGVIAVFSGTNLVYKELERRTVYIIFTKPVTGWQFIVGKYVGLAGCLLMVVAAMGLFLGLLSWLSSSPSLPTLVSELALIVRPLALVYLELLFVIAAATFFSSFASPIMSVVFTFSLWLIGHFGESLRQLGLLSGDHRLAQVSDIVYMFLPDLASLTKIRSALMYSQHVPTELLTFITCYVLGYVVLLLLLASVVTEQREFP